MFTRLHGSENPTSLATFPKHMSWFHRHNTCVYEVVTIIVWILQNGHVLYLHRFWLVSEDSLDNTLHCKTLASVGTSNVKRCVECSMSSC